MNTPEEMMKATFRGLIGISVALVLSAVASAKGDTTKITISGAHLANPIEITDLNIVKEFQVWTGPGTTGCIGGRSNCIEGTEGFIVDWSSGAVVQRPNGLQHYEVAFYVIDARVPGQPGPEHLAYVVFYEYDPAASQGYVYVPGKGDQWYALNVTSIYRRREGKWFQATRAWQDAVVPLITPR
jgi:hypothetical protein